MELYLIRHPTPDIGKGICYGQSDIGVTHSFAQEAQSIHQHLDMASITHVYSSPLKRCKMLAETFQKEVDYDDRLLELDFGTWELHPWDAIPKNELDPWMVDFVVTKTPRGESYLELQKRALDFLSTLPQQNDAKIIVVTHAGVIRALLAHLLKIPLQNSFDIQLDYGHVIEIRSNATQFEIINGLVLK